MNFDTALLFDHGPTLFKLFLHFVPDFEGLLFEFRNFDLG
jgi:hypothetical protein